MKTIYMIIIYTDSIYYIKDHHVSCYDLRFPVSPLKVYQGHKKAVSYVKWLNDNEIVSA
jgi:hypothetical protein